MTLWWIEINFGCDPRIRFLVRLSWAQFDSIQFSSVQFSSIELEPTVSSI